jgi:hypothetical protein
MRQNDPRSTTRWKDVVEVVGQAAVVLSLVYVGIQVEQNTHAVQTETSQSLYFQGADRVIPVLQSPDVADLIVRASRAPETMSATDSLRYWYFLNLQLNEFEAAYTNLLQGTMDAEMARGWLTQMGPWSCRRGARDYWNGVSAGYHPMFREKMDSAIAGAPCGAP